MNTIGAIPRRRSTRYNPHLEQLEIRQLLTAAFPPSTPFGAAPLAAGQIIEAENFDQGGAGIAFQVASPSTAVSATPYRADAAVEVDPGDSNGPAAGYHVSNLSAGDWLQYSIDVPANGKYVINARYATPAAGASIQFSVDGSVNTPSLALGKTPGYTSWHSAQTSAISLTQGQHILRVTVDHNTTGLKVAPNFDWFNLTPIAVAPTSFTWKAGATAPVKTYEGSSAMVNGLIYTFGGFTTVVPTADSQTYQVYNPATNTWKKLGNIPGAQTHSGVAADPSTGIIYFIGGYLKTTQTDITIANVYAYYPTTNTWATLPPMPMPVSGGEAAVVNGQLHYFGGNEGQDRITDHGDHWFLDLSQLAAGTAVWQSAAPLPTPRIHSDAVVYNGLIYTFGGELGHELYHRQQVESFVYDPSADSWSSLSPMPIPKSHFEDSGFVFDGKIVLAGGQIDDSQSTASMVEYDPATDQWSQLPNLHGPLQGAVVVPWGNELISTGGYDGTSGNSTGNTWIAQWPAPAAPPVVVLPPITSPLPAAGNPFTGTPFNVGQPIEAENYDLGGEGIGYHAVTAVGPANTAYRAGDAITIQAGGSNGYNIGSTSAGEWLAYTVTIPASGTYTLQATCANAISGGQFHAAFSDGHVSPSIAVPATGNWSKYATVASGKFTLSAGTMVMEIFLDKASPNHAVGDFDSFQLVAAMGTTK